MEVRFAFAGRPRQFVGAKDAFSLTKRRRLSLTLRG
jgi:hypothetical protein